MEQSQVQDQNLVQKPRENLIHFAALLFRTMADKYGCSTTLNELLMMNYGFVCHVNGKDFCVTKASADLDMAKSTASRLLTGMRTKGFVKEYTDPSDRRRRIFKLADTYLARADSDISDLLAWCAKPENNLI